MMKKGTEPTAADAVSSLAAAGLDVEVVSFNFSAQELRLLADALDPTEADRWSQIELELPTALRTGLDEALATLASHGVVTTGISMGGHDDPDRDLVLGHVASEESVGASVALPPGYPQ